MQDQAEPSVTLPLTKHNRWSVAACLGFRLAFLYWVCYWLAAGALLPGISRGITWLLYMPSQVVLWVGVHVFHLTGVPASVHPTNFDAALHYVLCFCILVFALIGTGVWTVINHWRDGRREYRTLYAWLRLGLRFTLGTFLLAYGFLKIFGIQFGPPPLLYLTETYGDSSPMRLLWAFMGASIPYTVFGGLAEVIPGLLLLFRRTSTLGALISAGVMLNVVLLNFCYDVPLKLFSTHLLLASLFLLLPDASALGRIFFAGQAAALADLSVPPWEWRTLRWASHILRVMVISWIFYLAVVTSYLTKRETPAGHVSLYGVWAFDKTEGLPTGQPWVKALFDRQGEVLFIRADGKKDWYDANLNESSRSIDFLGTPKPTSLQWKQSADGTLLLTGTWLGNAVVLGLHRLTPEVFPLQKRGFHWVQEYPYNR
jgi:hypothetical protein